MPASVKDSNTFTYVLINIVLEGGVYQSTRSPKHLPLLPRTSVVHNLLNFQPSSFYPSFPRPYPTTIAVIIAASPFRPFGFQQTLDTRSLEYVDLIYYKSGVERPALRPQRDQPFTRVGRDVAEDDLRSECRCHRIDWTDPQFAPTPDSRETNSLASAGNIRLRRSVTAIRIAKALECLHINMCLTLVGQLNFVFINYMSRGTRVITITFIRR